MSTPDLLHSTEDAIVQAMAAEPSPEELDVVRDAVRQVVGDGKIAKFRDADLALLWRQLKAISGDPAQKLVSVLALRIVLPYSHSREAVISRKPHWLAYAAPPIVTIWFL